MCVLRAKVWVNLSNVVYYIWPGFGGQGSLSSSSGEHRLSNRPIMSFRTHSWLDRIFWILRLSCTQPSQERMCPVHSSGNRTSQQTNVLKKCVIGLIYCVRILTTGLGRKASALQTSRWSSPPPYKSKCTGSHLSSNLHIRAWDRQTKHLAISSWHNL